MDTLKIINDGDFLINRYNLRSHFNLDNQSISVLNYGDKKMIESLYKANENLHSPLYLCNCADLYCGFLSVEVTVNEKIITWKNFGWFSPLDKDLGHHNIFNQDDYMKRMKVFKFNLKDFQYELSSYI